MDIRRPLPASIPDPAQLASPAAVPGGRHRLRAAPTPMPRPMLMLMLMLMPMPLPAVPRRLRRRAAGWLAGAAACWLVACGGGEPPSEPAVPAATVPAGVQLGAVPLFHRQPLALLWPDAGDSDGAARSLLAEPRAVEVPPELRALSTQGLTDERVQAWSDSLGAGRARALAVPPAAPQAGVPAAGWDDALPPVVYTPAQLRAAHGLPAVGPDTAGLGPAARAALGAGQTVYIVAAHRHAEVLADLAVFSRTFGLPGCTAATPVTTARPLPAPAPAACELMLLSSAAGGTLATQAPGHDAAWATEIALQTQWVHAMAPLARLVVVQARDSGSGVLDAIALVNRLGPGVVSMGFGSAENASVLATEPLFGAAGMSYVAASGDSGGPANWPAVMPGVLAVGGTSLHLGPGGAARSQAAWALGAGGLSSVVQMPMYQAGLSIPGQSSAGATRRFRAVVDLAFNADPRTGQYLVLTPPGGTPRWYAAGGTSIAAAQWAGLLAVANAQRALAGRPPLGQPHLPLYDRFAPGSAAWAEGFADVTSGANGSCSDCRAQAGYDRPTGLGTPQAAALLPALARLP